MVMTRRSFIKKIMIAVSGFAYGCGAFDFFDGSYAIGTNFDGRWGLGMAGLKEVADLTGIAAGYRVIKQIKHNDVNVVITWNGTNSKMYRKETTWVEKDSVNNVRCRDVVSFNDGTNSILAWCFGADTAFRYSTNIADGAGTWTASTFAGTADNPKFFLAQQNSLDEARIVWVVDPNQIYFATSLINGTTISTGSTVGDAGSDEWFNVLVQDDSGQVLIAKRHLLYRWTNGPAEIVAGPYVDAPTDAGGQSDRANFEAYASVGGRLYFAVEGYKIIEVYRGVLTSEKIHPMIAGEKIPRMALPVNALTAAGGWLVVALGSGSTSTLKSVAHMPAGSALLQNTFAATSEIYVGRYQETPEGMKFVWHGILLTCTDLLRYMWFDEDDSYLYLASGASESINVQQVRCFFWTDNPGTHVVSSNLAMNTGTWQVELGKLSFDKVMQLDRLTADTIGLGSTTPSLEAQYRPEPDYENTAYSSLVVWTDNYSPERGCKFPPYQTTRELWLKFIGIGLAGSPDTHAILESAKVYLSEYPLVR